MTSVSYLEQRGFLYSNNETDPGPLKPRAGASYCFPQPIRSSTLYFARFDRLLRVPLLDSRSGRNSKRFRWPLLHSRLLYSAVRALRRHGLNCTFKTIKHMRVARRSNLECVVIFIATSFTARHLSVTLHQMCHSPDRQGSFTAGNLLERVSLLNTVFGPVLRDLLLIETTEG